MTDLEHEFRLTITPDDPDGSRRAERQRELGFLPEADPEYDDFAKRILDITGASWSGVNVVGEGQKQFFAGIYGPGTDPVDGPDASIGREMDADHGYCVHVVAREKAMALTDTLEYPRFATNPVVDKLGIRAYIGAPLVDDEGNTIGTVWAIDNKPHEEWTQDHVDRMKDMAAQVMARIKERSGDK